MTEPMTATPARAGLDELDALLAAATPGEWRVDAKGWIDAGEYDTVLDRGPVDCMAYCYGGTSTIEIDPADAALIVALRNRAPAMLAAIRAAYALAEELDRVAAVGDPARGSYDDGIRVSSHFAATSLRAALDEALGVAK